MKHQMISHATPIKPAPKRSKCQDPISTHAVLSNAVRGERPTYIARYNATIWRLVHQCTEQNIPYHVLGGFGSKEISFMKKMHGYVISKDPSERRQFHKIKSKAKSEAQHATFLACSFVETLKNKPEAIFDRMLSLLSKSKDAKVLLTNVHQCKGLEFETVVIAEDFPNPFEEQLSLEETHILFTALTRAKTTLHPPSSLKRLLEGRRDK